MATGLQPGTGLLARPWPWSPLWVGLCHLKDCDIKTPWRVTCPFPGAGVDRPPAPGPVLWVEANSLDGGTGRRGPVERSHPWLGAHPGSEGNTHVSLNPAGVTGLCPCGGRVVF